MKRILIVDDEAQVVNGVRALVPARQAEWEIQFAASGAAAIAAMEKQAFDLVCSEARMQTADGTQLLTSVSLRWPRTVRIVLSGYAHMEQAMRSVPTAHHYLSKPFTSEHFDNVVERCLSVQDLLSRPTLRSVVGRVKKMPTLPKTYEKLRVALAQPNVAVTDVAKIVGGDMVISNKVLQVVNSAYFRLSKQMTRIDQAVSYLGFATVRNLVLSVEVFSQWSKAGAAKCGFDADHMQAQALLTATVARSLAAGTSLGDDALVAGLLSDIGYLILVAECSSELVKARKLASDTGVSLYEAECSVIGATHAEVGAYLLSLWGFPYSIVEAVAHHHEPSAVAHEGFDLLSLLAIATVLTAEEESDSTVDDTAAREAFLRSNHAPFTWTKAQECVQAIIAAGDVVGA